MAKKAFLVGINDYPGSGSDLKGCVNDVCSGRQGHNPTDESSVMQITRFMHVVMPQFAEGNPASIAWCKRPGCPVDLEPLRWVQPGGLASMGA